MDNKYTISIAFAIFGMGCRMLVFMMGWDLSVSTQLYFLFLLLAIFFAVKEFFKGNPESKFGVLFKQGAQVGALFSLFVSIYTYIFYWLIDTSFFDDKKNERLSQIDTSAFTEQKMTSFHSNLDMVFNPGTQAMVTLMGFMMLGLTYAVIVGAILSKIPFFARNFK
jgi:hypothetical protein|tara:strand:- start:454 stop:951 length:498 start_codon:yes stop_codon:yes gene_type:complete